MHAYATTDTKKFIQIDFIAIKFRCFLFVSLREILTDAIYFTFGSTLDLIRMYEIF